jgi:hypothetical protein
MAAGYCPAKKLALTEGMGVRLDGFQNFRSMPIFWSPVHFFSQLLGQPWAAETTAKKLACPCIGKADKGRNPNSL